MAGNVAVDNGLREINQAQQLGNRNASERHLSIEVGFPQLQHTCELNSTFRKPQCALLDLQTFLVNGQRGA